MISPLDSFLADLQQMSLFWKTATLLIVLVGFYVGVKLYFLTKQVLLSAF